MGGGDFGHLKAVRAALVIIGIIAVALIIAHLGISFF